MSSKRKKRSRRRKKTTTVEIDPPLLTDTPLTLADYLELRAHLAAGGSCSESELRSDLGITGSGDAVSHQGNEETEEQKTEGLIEATFAETEDRMKACGIKSYPFELKGNLLRSQDEESRAVYSFLLFLWKLGEGIIKKPNGAQLFEEVCARAAAGYFGCSETEHYVFGFPRRVEPRGFAAAVGSLCGKLREGKADANFPGLENMKDAGLDIVAWREFPDQRASKLIAFGQCATGNDWWGKRRDLNPVSWCGSWLSKPPLTFPLKMFFVPHAVPRNQWHQLGYDAGLIFDRFRIAYHAGPALSQSLSERLQQWNQKAKALLR